jgi:4a-hydroxytetrahydrobiopterin dehydratase
LTDLLTKRCKPCEGGVPPLMLEQAMRLMTELHSDWSLAADETAISRLFSFAVFSRTIAFANAVAWIATTEGHHPEMTVNYSSCRVTWSTTAIGGLSENDFICAARVDRVFEEA